MRWGDGTPVSRAELATCFDLPAVKYGSTRPERPLPFNVSIEPSLNVMSRRAESRSSAVL
jgi:hypothetical protein